MSFFGFVSSDLFLQIHWFIFVGSDSFLIFVSSDSFVSSYVFRFLGFVRFIYLLILVGFAFVFVCSDFSDS
jgi:hypothetical protein